MADHRGQLVYDRATQVARVVVAPGPIADNETLSAPPSPRHQWSVDRWRLPLGDAKADRIAEVGVELMRRNAGGFSYQGYVYQIDDASQARITSLVVLAQANGGADWPVGFRFITTNNIGVPFSAEGFLVFAAASAKVTIARRLCARALKNAIDAATDAATLAAIDITSGWD
jgi:hypothetical protein